MKTIKTIKTILLLILILVVTYSSSIYIIRLGQGKFIEDLCKLEPGLYAIIPIDIRYMFLSIGILMFGAFLLCIILGCFKGGGTIEEC